MPHATRSADVVVIGAGVIGLSTAVELRRAGLRVTVIERGVVGRGSASWAGGGILSPLEPDGVDEATTPLLRDSLARYAAWCDGLHQASGIDPEYLVSGLQVLAPADAGAWQQAARRWNLVSRVIVPGAVEGPRPVVELPDVAQVRSPRLLRALLGAFLAAGGECIENEAGVSLQGGSRITGVMTAAATYSAGVVVVAAGAWSDGLGAKVAVRPVRGQMLLLQARPGEVRSIVLRQGRYLVPRRDGVVLVGSTIEDVGFADQTTEEARASLLDSVRDLAPGLADRRVLAHWSGLRPAPSGSAPLIGWHPERRGLLLNSGHHRLGITLAPGSARRVAQLILEGRS